MAVKGIFVFSRATVLGLSWNFTDNYKTSFSTTFMFWSKSNLVFIMAKQNRLEQGSEELQIWNSMNLRCKLHISSLNHYLNLLSKIIYTIYHLNNNKYS